MAKAKPSEISDTELDYNARFKLQLHDFQWSDKVSRLGGKILRFSLTWSVESPDLGLLGQDQEGCIAFCDNKGEITWHPAMSVWGKTTKKHVLRNSPDLYHKVRLNIKNSSFGKELENVFSQMFADQDPKPLKNEKLADVIEMV